MSLEEFAELVQRMRNAQREYFRTKSLPALRRAKTEERKVDRALQELASLQKTLF